MVEQETETLDLTHVVTEGTMRAAAMYAGERNIEVDPSKVTARMRELLGAEYGELLATLKDALDAHMGGAMYRGIINTYCTAWGVKAVRTA